MGLLQYALEVDAGNAGEPEEVVLHDHVLQGIGAGVARGDLRGGVLLSERADLTMNDEPCRRSGPRRPEEQPMIPQPLVELHGWGRASGTMSHLAQIDSVADAVSALRTSDSRRGVVPRGLGRSYGDAAQNAGGTALDLTKLNRILSVDAAANHRP